MPRATALSWELLSCAEISTLVISQPWRAPLVLPPTGGLTVPNVQLVSIVPLSLLICEAKKFKGELFGPESVYWLVWPGPGREARFGPNCI